MKGRNKKASGGVNEAAQDMSKKNMKYTYESNVNDEAVERKHGGKTVGKMAGAAAKMSAGRKPRKSGGRLLGGSDWSAAQKSTPPAGRNVSGSIN
jgi:hypothetical protein